MNECVSLPCFLLITALGFTLFNTTVISARLITATSSKKCQKTGWIRLSCLWCERRAENHLGEYERDADLLDSPNSEAHYHPKMRIKTSKRSQTFCPVQNWCWQEEQRLCLITDSTFPKCQHTINTDTRKRIIMRSARVDARNQDQNWTFDSYKTFIVCKHIFQVCHGNLFFCNQT